MKPNLDDIAALRDSDPPVSWPEIGRRFNMEAEAVRSWYRRAIAGANQPRGEEAQEPRYRETPDGMYASSATETIKTLEDLVAACEIDLTIWRVAKWEVHPYQGYRRDEYKELEFDDGKITGRVSDRGKLTVVTLYSIKAWLVHREEYSFEQALLKLVEEYPQRIKAKPKLYKENRTGEHLFLPAFFDVHIGRRTLTQNYPPERAAQELIHTGEVMVRRVKASGLSVDEVWFPMGNDALNADNLQGTTTRGTWQEMAGDQRDSIDAAIYSMTTLVELMRELGPVRIIMVGGNHDRYSDYWLGHVLSAHFRDCSDVAVDNERQPRKYRRYGANLIGMEHGDRTKPDQLAHLMAGEAKQDWALSKYYTFLRGHTHKERGMYTPITDRGGVRIMTLPAFCPIDEWELIMGYMGGNRVAEGHFFHTAYGPAGTFPVFVDELETG